MKIPCLVKSFALPVLLVLLPASLLSAIPPFSLSAGGGILMGGLFTGYTINANETNSSGEKIWMNLTQEMQQFDIGAWLFFDATYAVFSVDIQEGFNSYREGGIISQNSIRAEPEPVEGSGRETTLGLTLMAKYPFRIRESLFIYPLAGISYRIALVEKRTPKGSGEYNRADGKTEFNPNGDYRLSMWNSWMVNIGTGLDFYFINPLYLRTELVYSFRLMTAYEDAAVEWLVDTYGISKPKLFADPGMRGLTHGPEIRLALGNRLK